MSPKQASSGLGFNIVDADSHWDAIPPDLYQRRVPGQFRDRAPKPLKGPDGKVVMSYDNGRVTRPIFREQEEAGARNPEMQVRDRVGGPTLVPGLSGPEQRIKDMELDGVYSSVIYSLNGFQLNEIYRQERDLLLACIQAYNDWLIEEVSQPSNNRIFALCITPQTGTEDALAEMERCVKKGHKGIILGRWPNGTHYPNEADDLFWAAAQDMNVPISIHVVNDFLGDNMGAMTGPFKNHTPSQFAIGAVNTCGVTTIPIVDVILGQAIVERFPGLKIGLIESNIGWIPHYLEQVDKYWAHYRFTVGKSHLKMLPSEQFRQNFWASFLYDPHGVENRHTIGVDRVMWSTDFPHGVSEWPNSRSQIDNLFTGVPQAELKMMLHDNACEFYGLTGV